MMNELILAWAIIATIAALRAKRRLDTEVKLHRATYLHSVQMGCKMLEMRDKSDILKELER